MLLNCSASLLLYRPESSSVGVLGLNPALGPPLRAPPSLTQSLRLPCLPLELPPSLGQRLGLLPPSPAELV